ncbi:ATP-binding cassette domain-containing protein [Nordella sp. HKS 07]|uniref:ABC transporter ATP-binding protein n=1 Tax=Nordella sp. HKS 07 TaxID=2712222 RepID=UPI0013E0EB79|nr:oligopeptide/dipeptide ABC transporter ATP-binding protein [Nordella sp. HKS 07]QIG48771.1 ATP-binding cassette domain-containing protein [Nordella sp. HKS 07]
MSASPLLRIRALTRRFNVGGGRVLQAVNGVDLEIARGEIFGLVGESGCGKSTLGRTIKGIHPPSSGSVEFDGQDITRLDRRRARDFARRMQMIFQDPYSSLNPRMTVRELIGEGLEIHRLGTAGERQARIVEMMRLVGLNPEYQNRFAHEFSGGQRQRIAIARALVVAPDFVICDEPISALDVSIQGQIINLLKELKQRIGLTYLFIAHDLSMVKYISDRVGVMYLGRLVEVATKEKLFSGPKHPYTQALLSSVPIPDPVRERARIELTPKGELPSPMEVISGCAFRTRCPHAGPRCAEMRPQLTEAEPGHFVMCTLHGTPIA